MTRNRRRGLAVAVTVCAIGGLFLVQHGSEEARDSEGSGGAPECVGELATTARKRVSDVGSDAASTSIAAPPAARQGAYLRGVVLDVSGSPAPGVQVEVRVRTSDAGGNTGTVQMSVTGEDGQFESLWRRGDVVVVDVPLALGGVSTPGALRLVEDAFVELRLHAPRETRGRVVDESGVAIPGATVFAVNWGRHGLETLGECVTDSDGRFRVLGALPAKSGLVARAAGFAQRAVWRVRCGELPSDIVMAPSRALRGRVVRDSDGTPIEGALVVVQGAPEVLGGSLRGVTNGAGEFAIHGFEFGEMADVVIDVGELGGAHASIRVDDGDAEVRVPEPWALRGRVVAGVGVRVANRRVVVGLGRRAEGARARRAETDMNGEFVVRGLFGRKATVNLARSESDVCVAPRPRNVVLRGSGTEPELVIERRFSIRGRVVGPNDEPVVGAIVAPGASGVAVSDWAHGQAISGADGMFILVGVQRFTPMCVVAKHSAFGEAAAHFRASGDGSDVVGMTIELPGRCGVSGRVVDEAGRPVEGALVSVLPARSPISDTLEGPVESVLPRAVTTAAGTYNFDGLARGKTYRFFAYVGSTSGEPAETDVVKRGECVARLSAVAVSARDLIVSEARQSLRQE